METKSISYRNWTSSNIIHIIDRKIRLVFADLKSPGSYSQAIALDHQLTKLYEWRDRLLYDDHYRLDKLA